MKIREQSDIYNLNPRGGEEEEESPSRIKEASFPSTKLDEKSWKSGVLCEIKPAIAFRKRPRPEKNTIWGDPRRSGVTGEGSLRGSDRDHGR